MTVSETFYIGTPLSHDPEFIEIPSSEGMESMLMIATSPEKIATSPEIAGLRENVSALEEQLKKSKSERDQFAGACCGSMTSFLFLELIGCNDNSPP